MTFANPRSATLLEQAVVSATGFLTMIFFARHLSTADWATFSFAAGLLLVAQGMQLSVVILPMISFSRGALLSRQDQADWTWMNRWVLVTMLTVATVAAGLVHWRTSSWMAASCLYAALLMPPAFTYEYLRRRLILTGQFSRLAVAGLAYATGVALGVLGNHRFGGSSPLAAALSTWPGMLLALCVARSHEPVRWAAPAAPWLRPLRAFAPSAAGSSLAMAGYSVAIQALLGGMSGAQALASFNATRILVQPVNALIGAFNNLDMPNSAKAYAEGGRALVRFQARSVLRLAAIGGAYLLTLGLFAEPLLTRLFNGRYSQSELVWSWVLVGFLMLIVTPTENTFYVTGRTSRLFASRLAAAAVGCGFAYYSIPQWAAVGGVLSVAAGWTTAFIGGATALWAVRNQGPVTDAA
jgi:O-antigen/teichoic acid export membrane protein